MGVILARSCGRASVFVVEAMRIFPFSLRLESIMIALIGEGKGL